MQAWWRRSAGAAVVLLGILAIPAYTAADIDGARIYRRDCARCHGPHGRGDGPDAAIFTHPPRNLRTEFLTQYSTPELVRRIRRGMPLRLDVDPKALQAQSRDVAALVAHVERLPKVDWARVEGGREIFAERCEPCHGTYGRPTAPTKAGAPAPRDLADPAFQRDTSEDDIRVLIRHGRAGMRKITPPLTDRQTTAVAAYVRLFSPGFELYQRFCVNCHGDDGRGTTNAPEGTARPTVLDAAYFASHDADHLRESVLHMLTEKKPQMPHLRHEVTETGAQAIIHFLKGLQEPAAETP